MLTEAWLIDADWHVLAPCACHCFPLIVFPLSARILSRKRSVQREPAICCWHTSKRKTGPQATLKNENNFCLPCAAGLRRWTLGIYSCFGSSARAQWFPLPFHFASPVTFFHPVFFIGWADARIYKKSLVSPTNWAFSLLLLRCLVAGGLWEQMGPGRRERKARTQACHEILMDYAWDILTCWGCESRKVWMPTPTIWSTEFQKKLLVRRCACNAWPQEMLSAPRRCLDAPHRWPQNFYVRPTSTSNF